MAVREFGDVKGIQGINVQEDGVTQVSIANTVNIVGGGTVTDVAGVATINIPQGVTWYREDVTAGSATYTFVNSPATSTSFLVFTDSGTLMFSGVDYTYDPDTETITFLSLGNNEAAYIWVAHALITGGGIGDMVKAVYDPTNINSSAFDMDNFVDGTNKHYVTTTEKGLISSALQPGDNVSELVNDAGYALAANVPTTVAELSDASDYVTDTELSNTLSSYALASSVPTKTSDLVNDSGFLTSAGDVDGPASSTDGNIVVFDGATGKVIKDSGMKIVVSNSPSGNICEVYYDNGTIYLKTVVVTEDYLLLESGDDILTEGGDKFVLES